MGLFFGCAALVNQVVILLPLVLFAAFFLLKAHKATLAKPFAVALLTMMAIIIPWTVRNYQVSGQIIPVHIGGVTQFVRGNHEFEHYGEAPLQSVKLDHMGGAYAAQLLGYDDVSKLDETAADFGLLPYALSYVRNEPGKLLTKIVVQIPRFWYLSESPLKSRFLAAIQGAFLLLALVGVFDTLRSNRYVLSLLLTVVYFNLDYAATHAEARYSTPVIPYVIILAAAGLRTIFVMVRKFRLQWAAKAYNVKIG